jgi:hypothetical protein
VRESDGVEVKRILQDLSYDFNFQEVKVLPDLIEIPPGHSLHVECTYNTMSYQKPVLGGEGTTDEMCMVFLWHYPINSKALWCMSQPTFPIYEFAARELEWKTKSINSSLVIAQNVTLDGKNMIGRRPYNVIGRSEELWKQNGMAKKWQEYARLPTYVPQCSGKGADLSKVFHFNLSNIVQPKLTKTLPMDICDKDTPMTTISPTDPTDTSASRTIKPSTLLIINLIVTALWYL